MKYNVVDTIPKDRADMKKLETMSKKERTKFWVNKIEEMYAKK
jgi:hypothetical protein